LIFGASGGIGHLAVQFAKRMGAYVLAVASGDDGVAFVRGLGADKVVDGHKEDVLAAARQFAPNGLDAVLLTTGGEAAEKSLAAVRTGGRVAYPNGVQPVPKERAGIKLQSYDGEYNPPLLRRGQPPYRRRSVRSQSRQNIHSGSSRRRSTCAQ